MTVHLLCTCRKPELLRAATLVFDSIRVGFPTATLDVFWNGLADTPEMERTRDSAKSTGANFVCITHITHHQWLHSLVKHATEPLIVADTDLVFFDNFERFEFGNAILAGRYTPQFRCKFANAITKPRLHTCLLWIDPVKVREAVTKYGERFPDCYATPRPTLEDLIFPRYIPQRVGMPYFYDTASLLYQAIGGHSFTPEQLDSFSHLNSGTLSDLVAPAYPEYRIRETHFSIYENPQLAKGNWRLHDAFYAANAC